MCQLTLHVITATGCSVTSLYLLFGCSMSSRHLLTSSGLLDVVRPSGVHEYCLLDAVCPTYTLPNHLWMWYVQLRGHHLVVGYKLQFSCVPICHWWPAFCHLAYNLVILYCIVQQTTARHHSRPGKLKQMKIVFC